ncbi:MAG: calcium-binding protein [Sulfuricurvum sp.]|nr:calcium-binding protein [Sulfuricurvum sp.]
MFLLLCNWHRAIRIRRAIELIYGSNGNDTITLGTKAQYGIMNFGAGEDRLILAKGNNYVSVANIEYIMGNKGNDTIVTHATNTSDMTINGGLGNDILTGGNKSNTYVFSSKLNAKTNVDTITNFTSSNDTINLDKLIFKAVANGFSSDNLVIGTQASDNDDYFIYNPTTNILSYDVDGNGSKKSVDFIILQGVDTLSATDFQLI